MTPEEVSTVISLCLKADGNCSYCAAELILEFIKEFPEHKDEAIRRYEKRYKESPYGH